MDIGTDTRNGLQSSNSGYKIVGTRPVRHDGVDKVTGRAVYGADVKLPGLIWADALRSPYAHARILSIDTSEAESMPGVFAVCTAKDLPALQTDNPVPNHETSDFRLRAMTIMAKDKAMYKGHMVAAVAAIDRNTASIACNRIKVEYEPLPPVLTVKEAISSDVPILHENMIGDDLGERVARVNVATHFRHALGDVKEGFTECDTVVEREFSLKTVHQGYIEPHNATASWDEEGNLVLWSSTQGMFGVRSQTAGILHMDESRVKVNPVEIGGGFGGKTVVYLPPIAAVLSRKSGRPVKMVMDRSSVFQATGPAPGGVVKIRIGVDSGGKIKAAEADIWLEAGAFPGSSVPAAAVCVLAAYDIPNVRIDGYDVLVNKPKSAAYRAPGSPQAAFAVEQVIDEICEKTGRDKLQFRLDNAAKEGTRRGDGILFKKIGLEETLQAAMNSDHWRTPLEKSSNGKLRGRGVATGFWRNGGNKSSSTLFLNSDGVVFLNEGSQDIGGTRASIAMQVAERLGLKAEDVHPYIPDTESIGFTATTGGSRVTYATGLAAWLAAGNLIDELKIRSARLWRINKGDVEFDSGTFFSKSDPELKISLQDMARRTDETGGPVQASGSVNLTDAGSAFGVHICDLEIDPETGKTDVIRYTALQDVGTAIHPSYVENQMQGGVAQGIGWTLNEEYHMNKDGGMNNHSYLDYRMPTALDLPRIETVIVEIPNPLHPYGVRGVGEVPIVPPLGAVANAVKDATGVRFFQTPISPGTILAALEASSGAEISV